MRQSVPNTNVTSSSSNRGDTAPPPAPPQPRNVHKRVKASERPGAEAKETYVKAKETYVQAKETYSEARETFCSYRHTSGMLVLVGLFCLTIGLF
jgi:hypothetical protein